MNCSSPLRRGRSVRFSDDYLSSLLGVMPFPFPLPFSDLPFSTSFQFNFWGDRGVLLIPLPRLALGCGRSVFSAMAGIDGVVLSVFSLTFFVVYALMFGSLQAISMERIDAGKFAGFEETGIGDVKVMVELVSKSDLIGVLGEQSKGAFVVSRMNSGFFGGDPDGSKELERAYVKGFTPEGIGVEISLCAFRASIWWRKLRSLRMVEVVESCGTGEGGIRKVCHVRPKGLIGASLGVGRGT